MARIRKKTEDTKIYEHLTIETSYCVNNMKMYTNNVHFIFKVPAIDADDILYSVVFFHSNDCEYNVVCMNYLFLIITYLLCTACSVLVI